MNETGRRDVPLFRGGSRDGVEEVVSFFGHFDLYLKFVSFVFQNLLGSLLPETRPPRPSDVCLIPWYLQSYVGKREDANKKKTWFKCTPFVPNYTEYTKTTPC